MIKTFNYIFLLVLTLSGLNLKANDHGIPNVVGTWVGINKTISEQRGFRSWEKKVEIIYPGIDSNRIKFNELSKKILKFLNSYEFVKYKFIKPEKIETIEKLNQYVRLKINKLSV